MPIGTLTKKIHSQERNSVSTPPSSRPAAAPPAAIAPQTASAFVRSSTLGEGGRDDRQRGGGDQCGAEALQRAGADEHRVRGREAVDQRRDGEDRRTGDEQPSAAEKIGHPPAQQQEAAEHQRVAVDDPLQGGVGDVQVGLDRRQRDVHDGGVENDHELREADDDEG